MLAVLLTVHMIACVVLVIAVMLQRSEGGALGMGGGGTGGLISGRGAATVLVRVTMGLAAVFFVTSVLMTRLNAENAKAPSSLQQEIQKQNQSPFDPLGGTAPSTTTPSSTAPATTTPSTTVPASPAPAPAAPVIDPLAPKTTPPASTTTPPAATTTPAPKPAAAAPAPAPATNTPAPATTPPQNGGSPN